MGLFIVIVLVLIAVIFCLSLCFSPFSLGLLIALFLSDENDDCSDDSE